VRADAPIFNTKGTEDHQECTKRAIGGRFLRALAVVRSASIAGAPAHAVFLIYRGIPVPD
jgi:hypothetical protein